MTWPCPTPTVRPMTGAGPPCGAAWSPMATSTPSLSVRVVPRARRTGFATRAVPVDGGFLVSGRKIFASLSEAADLPQRDLHGRGRGRHPIPWRACRRGEGITIEGDWDPLGMRGTISKNLLFEDVFVPADNEFLPPGCFDQMADRWPYFYMTLSFSYLGIQRAVLDFTADYLRGAGGVNERRDHPQKQHGWAEMRLAYDRSQALTYRVLGEAGVDPTDEQVGRAWSATVTAMETAPEIASTAVRVCGGRSLLRPSALERMYRDARCGATMLPWSVEVCLGRLGRAGPLRRLTDDPIDEYEGAGHGRAVAPDRGLLGPLRALRRDRRRDGGGVGRGRQPS